MSVRPNSLAGITGGVPGSAVQSSRRIVVGHHNHGDTAADVDFLETGDGSAIADALAQASPFADVYIRPGDYSKGTSLPYSIPDNVRVVGAGSRHVTIRPPALGNQGAFILNASSYLEGVSIVVPVPVGPTVGATSVVDVASFSAYLEDVLVGWSGPMTAPGAANLTLRSSFSTGGFSTLLGMVRSGTHPLLTGSPRIRQFIAADYVTCDFTAGFESLRDCLLQGGDHGLILNEDARVTGCTINSDDIVVQMTGDGNSLSQCQLRVTGAGAATAGVVVSGEQNTLSGNYIDGDPTGDIGIHFQAGGSDCIVSGCVVDDWDEAVVHEIGADNSIVTGNRFVNSAVGIADAGAGNVDGNNIQTV